jgi:hypothetical protein
VWCVCVGAWVCVCVCVGGCMCGCGVCCVCVWAGVWGGVCVWYTVQNAQCTTHMHITNLNKICRHNTEYGYNDTYTITSNVILAKHGLWLSDDGLCKPQHVGAAFTILVVLIV